MGTRQRNTAGPHAPAKPDAMTAATDARPFELSGECQTVSVMLAKQLSAVPSGGDSAGRPSRLDAVTEALIEIPSPRRGMPR